MIIDYIIKCTVFIDIFYLRVHVVCRIISYDNTSKWILSIYLFIANKCIYNG